MTQALYAGEHLCRVMDSDGCSPDWQLYPIFVQMSEELSYKSSLNVPLLPEWKHNDEDKAIASHPSTKNSVSFFRTCLKGLNAISGTLIKRCMDKNSNIRTCPDIGELAFGKTGRLIVSVSMYTELYLVSIGFLILEEKLSYLNEPLLHEWEHREFGHATDEEKVIASHPSTENTASFFGTCLNGLNAISGVGILSVPYALASGGWLSLVLLFAIATTAFYTGMLIKRCMDKYSNIRTYPDIGELAFGKTGRLIVSVSMYTELYLVSIGFLILEGDNLSNLFPIGEVQIAGLAIGGKQFFVIVVSLIILPTVWLDNLSLLSYVSASGVFASAFIILSISWTATFDGVGFHQKGTSVNWNGIPTAVSLYAFCYCAHPVFPTLYNSMTNKHQFSNVLLLCFLLTTVGYASMAIIGYLMFGADVESQITLNLPLNKVSSKLAIYITLVNPISKYALMATPITNALKDLLPSTYKNRVTNILVSTVMVIGTTIVALVVPFYGYLMSLVGAFLSVTASILLPCFCYLKISGSYRRFEWHAKDEEKVTDSYPSTENTASFFHTCFNGLNAISAGEFGDEFGMDIENLIPDSESEFDYWTKSDFDPDQLRFFPSKSELSKVDLTGSAPLPYLLLIPTKIIAYYRTQCFQFSAEFAASELAFGKTGRLMISGLMYTELYLVSIGFLILEGDNLSNLFPNREIQIAGFVIGGKQLFVILVALIILPTVWLDNFTMS
ncbi:Amino acid transporter AVT1I [Glycine soja]|uniref:Amino acid transporter AVT1I n=1 Tax=Glycine soja TaxID=3848 RepID=A0A445FXT6_GLYSO|nr:Amino acid transporter AVT1I [Glycine soja]